MKEETQKKPRRLRRDFAKLNAGAITYAKASLKILETIADDGASPTLKANIEGQKSAYGRMLAELGEA